jgi:hypothetical protein
LAASVSLGLECLEDRCLLATGFTSLSATGVTLYELTGQEFTASVAQVQVASATDIQAAIDWGDGHTSAGTLQHAGAADIAVLGTHSYQTSGFFSVSVTITAPPETTVTATSEMVVLPSTTTTFTPNFVPPSPSGVPVPSTGNGGFLVNWLPEGQGTSAAPSVPPKPAEPIPAPGLAPRASPADTDAAILGAAVAKPTEPRPVDPTTFVLWISQYEQGGTIPQPEPTRVTATELTTVGVRSVEPARLDVEAFFVAQKAREEADLPPVVSGGLGAWMRDEAVVAALADAVPAQSVISPVSAPLTADTAASGSAEEQEGESRETRQGEDGFLGRLAPWLVVAQIVGGLSENRNSPEPARSPAVEEDQSV